MGDTVSLNTTPPGIESRARALAALAEQLRQWHGSGRLHFGIVEGAIGWSEGKPSLAEPANVRTWSPKSADEALLPSVLRDSLPLELSTDRRQADQELSRHGMGFSAVQIDVYQLGKLAGHWIAEVTPEEYLRSVRAKAAVPKEWRPLLESAWSIDGPNAFVDVEAFLSALHEIARQAGIELPASESPTASESAERPTATLVPKTTFPAAHDLPAISRLGGYEIRECIGRGGMGIIYRGFDPALKRDVAIKVLPDELARQNDFVERFYNEAAAVARLSHPNVIPIHFIGEDAGRHFFVMPFIRGESLSERLRREGRVSIVDTLGILDDVLAGLQSAHDRGLIHRDIKPGNVLLETSPGRAVVADFGLVKTLNDSAGRTATGLILGTVDYLSPEQGRGRKVDHRSDLYSVGVLLYQMVSGRLPFQSDSPTALIFQHVYERPAQLPDIVPDLPPALWAITCRLMAKSPDARYQSAQAVRDDLRAARDRRPLPSGVDRRNLDVYWKPVSLADAAAAAIVAAPPLEKCPAHVELLLRKNWWQRLQLCWASWWRAHRPEWLAELATTQHRVDDALGDYEHRRDRLGSLVREARSVIGALESQREVGDAVTISELDRLIAQQRNQLAQLEGQFSKADVTYRRLQHQRDELQARLQIARSRQQVMGVKRLTTTAFLSQPTLLQSTVLLGLLGILGIVLIYRRKELSEYATEGTSQASAAARSENLSATARQTNKSTFTQLERRLVLSHDGRLAVLADYIRATTPNMPGQDAVTNGELKSWDLTTGVELSSFESPHQSQELALSRDQRWLLSQGRDHLSGEQELRLWNVSNGKLLHRIQAPIPQSPIGIAFTQDGRKGLALIGNNQPRELAVIDVADGTIEKRSLPHTQDYATALAASPISNLVAIAVSQNTYGPRNAIDIHDLTTGKILVSLGNTPATGMSEQTIRSLAFSSNGKTLVASLWSRVRLYDTTNWNEISEFTDDRRSYQRMAVSEDARYIALTGSGYTKLWDAQKQAEIPLSTASAAIDVAFGPKATLLVTLPQLRFQFVDASTGKALVGANR